MRSDFNRLLKELDEEELRDELKALYGRFGNVREYYKMELGANTQAILDKYKKELRRCFFKSRRRINRRARSESKLVLKAFAEVSIHPRDLVELHLYRAEVMVEAILHFRNESEPFHTSALKAYEHALRLAQNEVLQDSFKQPAWDLANRYMTETGYAAVSFWPAWDGVYTD